MFATCPFGLSVSPGVSIARKRVDHNGADRTVCKKKTAGYGGGYLFSLTITQVTETYHVDSGLSREIVTVGSFSG